MDFVSYYFYFLRRFVDPPQVVTILLEWTVFTSFQNNIYFSKILLGFHVNTVVNSVMCMYFFSVFLFFLCGRLSLQLREPTTSLIHSLSTGLRAVLRPRS